VPAMSEGRTTLLTIPRPLGLLTVLLLSGASTAVCGGGGGADKTPTPTVEAELQSEDIIPLYKSSAVFILSEGFYGGAFSGTGIVLDDQGDILTNNHVVEGAGSISVRDPESGKKISAQIVGRSPCDDLAVIKARDASTLKPAQIGSSSELKQGSQVYAVGYPGTPDQDFGNTTLSITGGLVSKLGAQFDYFGLQNTIQIDAAVNHGNSGGPLVDKHGKVVGVNTLAFSSAGLENVNYSIAIDEAKKVYDQLLTGKDIDWLGVNLEPNDPSYEDQYGIPYYADSAVIVGVDTSSPLFEQDWVSGDLILAAEGKIVRSPGDLCSVIRSHRSGDKILIEGYGQFTDQNTGESYYDNYSTEITRP
jgi:serine protease Do